jgi:hypothetical protein
VVIAGLGWVSVTGPGSFKVRVTAPKDTLVGLRPALLPYEAPLTTVSFTGGRLKRKGAIKRVVNGRKGTLGDVKRNAQEEAGGKKRKFSAWKLRAGVGNAPGKRREGASTGQDRAGMASDAPGGRRVGSMLRGRASAGGRSMGRAGQQFRGRSSDGAGKGRRSAASRGRSAPSARDFV